MKKIALSIGVVYVLLYLAYPKMIEVADKAVEEKVVEETSKYIELFSDLEDDMERIWGEIEGIPYMLYKDVDSYIYIDGSFYEVDGYWENDAFIIERQALKDIIEGNHVQSVRSNLSCENLTQNEVVNRLSRVNIPLEDATITTFEGQLPGAVREYRNGYHEGFDWYTGTSGVVIDADTDVFPMYAGKIVRIDGDYVEMSQDFRNKILLEAAERQSTPQKTLDLLRGRQVWVQSPNGVLVKYAHLSSVNNDLKVGDYVTTNMVLGKVGNSGTSNGVTNTTDDYHLHSDILVCGKLFWEYGEIEEMNQSVIEIFNNAQTQE